MSVEQSAQPLNHVFAVFRWVAWLVLAIGSYFVIFGFGLFDLRLPGGVVFLLWLTFVMASSWIYWRSERFFGLERSDVTTCLIAFQLVAAVFWGIAVQNLYGAIDRGKQKRAMADVRFIGTQVELYSIRHNDYPDVEGIDALEKLVGTELPRKDPWYGRYLFTKNGEGTGYRVICTAADRKLDPPSVDGYQGQSTSFEDDIVMVNGQFVQWPEGSQQ